MKHSFNFNGRETILEQLGSHRHALEAPCGGKGLCGKCLVRLEVFPNLPIPVAEELECLTQAQLSEGWRLACLSRPEGVGFVHWQNNAAAQHAFLAESSASKMPSDAKRSLANTSCRYGVAVDIGTTTVAASLTDLSTGERLANCSALNAQKAFGLDVLSRITYQTQTPGGADALHLAIVTTLDTLMTELLQQSKILPDQLYEVTIAANTAMLHFLMKLPAESLGKAPYHSQVTGAVHTDTKTLGLNLPVPVPCFLLPPVSAYIGGDISSGILELALSVHGENSLLIDIGTNGELVLFNQGAMAACSCAAGPAFEGMNLSCGMRAESGAVSSFEIDADGTVLIETIGNEPVRGICGSGVFDLMAVLIRQGFLGPTGRILAPEQLPKPLATFVVQQDGKRALCFDSPMGQLTVTQQDIRQIQLAKAALRSGIDALLDHFQLSFEDLNTICIAGQFGRHLKANSLSGIGILPESTHQKLVYVGNTAHGGAETCLLDEASKAAVSELAGAVAYIELAELPDYEKLFVDCLRI